MWCQADDGVLCCPVASQQLCYPGASSLSACEDGIGQTLKDKLPEYSSVSSRSTGRLYSKHLLRINDRLSALGSCVLCYRNVCVC